MSNCKRCGAYIPMGESRCPACGYEAESRSAAAFQAIPRQEQSYQETFEYEIFDGENEQTRKMSALCYAGPLFFVPLLLKKDSEYIRFHANQGCSLFLCELASFGLLPGLIGLAGKAGCIYLAVKGIKNASAGVKEKMPVIGDWNLIKGKK